jgi:YihY family inner membrane protein
MDAAAPATEEGGAVNPVERVVRAIDRFQQRHLAPGVAVAVVKKFGDDRGGTLATSLAYSAFVALFPLLLLCVTVLGFVLGHSRSAEDAVLRSALVEFPIVGDQLVRSFRPLRGSGLALAVGLVGLVWGGFGVTQTAQHAMAEVWNVPGVHRPNFVHRMGRSAAVLGIGGLGLLATSALASVSTFSGRVSAGRLALVLASTLLNVVLLGAAFRMTTPRTVPSRRLVAGVVAGAVAWTALQALGGWFVGHQLRHTTEVYGFFATVLGLMSWVFLGARTVLYAAEANVVLARRLWPRSIVQPPLTEADKRTLAHIAQQEERRPEEQVEVTFDDPDEPDDPADVDDPEDSKDAADTADAADR